MPILSVDKHGSYMYYWIQDFCPACLLQRELAKVEWVKINNLSDVPIQGVRLWLETVEDRRAIGTQILIVRLKTL